MSADVLIVDIHANQYADELRRAFPDLRVHTSASRADLPGDLSRFDALVAFGIAVDDDVLGRLSNLKWVQSLATGVDHFLRSPTLAPGAIITSGRGIHGSMMREMTLHLLLCLTHNTPQQAADQRNHVWERRLWSLLYEKTAVVVGIGVAGIAIGEALHALGMRVIGVSRTPRPIAAFSRMVPTGRLHEAATQADFLINVLPASPQNLNLFDAALFGAMKPTGYFVNVGRGETVDEDALLAALRENRIAGAGLDVFRQEPLPPDSPFWDLSNVVITPHIGGYVPEYEHYVMPILIENMQCFLAGRAAEMRNVVPRPAPGRPPRPA
jgi:D-2-hydroxyacid dehydrogenase (NADP+)